jgi:hypothetical protein
VAWSASEPAALDHEARDHAVELRAVVVLRLNVVEEIGDRLGRGIGIELDLEAAGGRVELDLRVGGEGGDGERRGQCDGGGGEETLQHRVTPSVDENACR